MDIFQSFDEIINDFFMGSDELIEKYQQKAQEENK